MGLAIFNVLFCMSRKGNARLQMKATTKESNETLLIQSVLLVKKVPKELFSNGHSGFVAAGTNRVRFVRYANVRNLKKTMASWHLSSQNL
jgi:hypothetical protein